MAPAGALGPEREEMASMTSAAGGGERGAIHGQIATRIDRPPLIAIQWRLAILVDATWGFMLSEGP
jgi:hypothetical protein